jgi:TonB-linked SusC/RagA family outer membrane protein
MPSVARAQDAVITGRVTAEGSGAGITGATIAITELGVGVLTGENGSYTLTVPAARVRGQSTGMVARFIGYVPLRRQITLSAGRQTQDFSIRQDVNRLNEVVITGVSAATERVKVPFAVTRIDSSQTPVPGVNALTQLQGKVPGANIVIASGRPGAAPSVLLRGPKSINAAGRSQDPLYIVDGVILSGGLPDLNSQDIEAVEVVKGAAAASLYGSQAANGVIQITTKQGRAARDGVRFGFRTEYGVSDVEREIDIAQRHALLMDETQTRFCAFTTDCQRTVDFVEESIRINDNPTDVASAPPALPIDLGSSLNAANARRLYQANPWPGNNYNAVQQLVQPKPLAIVNADMNGKFGGTNFFASVNRTDQGGSVRFLDGYTRNSARLNVNQVLGSAWNVTLNTFFARAEEDGLNQEGGGAAFFRLTRTPPIVDLTRTDSRGRLLVRPNIQGGGGQNENALYSLQNINRLDVTNRFVGSLATKYTPFTWLNADATLGYDNQDVNGRQFVDRGYRTTGPTASPGTNLTAGNNGLLLNYAENRRSLNGATGITIPNATPMISGLTVSPNVRFQYLQRDFGDRIARGSGLTVSGVEDLQNATQGTLTTSASRTSERQLTYSGGVRLEYKEPYVLDMNIRRDGNSAFGAEERWATYGRIAGTYVVSSEPFWEPISDKVNLFKLIANYGTSGLAPRFNAQYETYTIGAGGTLTPLTLGNPNLKPQVDKGSELGFELGVFNAVNLIATYAQSNTENQILPVPLPAVQGFQQQWQNVGTLRNRTVELSLSFPFYRANGIDWSGRLNYERTRTIVTRLDVLPFSTGSTAQATETMFRVAQGEQLGTIYGRAFVKSCSDLPEAFRAQCGGAGSAYQKNSDGLIVWTGGAGLGDGYANNLWNTSLPAASAPYGGDLAWGHPITRIDASGSPSYLPLGQALPNYRPSFSTNLSYKKFTAFGLLDGAIGQSVYNQGRHWSYLDFLSRDQDQANKSVADAKPASYYYRASPKGNGTGVGGLYDVLGPNNFFVEDASYVKLREVNLSYRFGELFGAGNWTVGVTGRNLLTFTNYKGFDPEVGLNGLQAGAFGSSALTAVDAFTFPNLRTFSFTVSSSF